VQKVIPYVSFSIEQEVLDGMRKVNEGEIRAKWEEEQEIERKRKVEEEEEKRKMVGGQGQGKYNNGGNPLSNKNQPDFSSNPNNLPPTTTNPF